MEAMRDVGVKRVVFISSGAVYGEQETQPLKESFTPKPGSPYAVSKLAAEYYVHTIGALWGIETVALRVFNAYGPGQQLPRTPQNDEPAGVIQKSLHREIHAAGEPGFQDGATTSVPPWVDRPYRRAVRTMMAPPWNVGP